MQIFPHNYRFRDFFKIAYEDMDALGQPVSTSMADKWRSFKSTIKSKSTSKWIPFLNSLNEQELIKLQQELPSWRMPPGNRERMQSVLNDHIQNNASITEEPVVPAEPVNNVETNVSPTDAPIETGPIDLAPSTDRGQMLEQLHSSYRNIWNSFIKEIRPRLKDTVKVHNDIINLITNSNVNQVWMAMRQALQSRPEMLNSISLSEIQNANQSISSAQQALNSISQSDQVLDNQLLNFQQSLLSTINSIKQISFSDDFTQPNAYAKSRRNVITAVSSTAKKIIRSY